MLAAPLSASAWSWPAGGAVVRPFVFGPDPYAAGQHRGIDVAALPGDLVVAPASGVVSFAGTLPTHGVAATIRTADGWSVTLLHLGSVSVSAGDSVAEGAVVAAIGASGVPEVAGPYVHLGIRSTSDEQGYVDPLGLLPPRVQPEPAAPPPALGPVEAPAAVDAPVGGAAAAEVEEAPAVGATDAPPPPEAEAPEPGDEDVRAADPEPPVAEDVPAEPAAADAAPREAVPAEPAAAADPPAADATAEEPAAAADAPPSEATNAVEAPFEGAEATAKTAETTSATDERLEEPTAVADGEEERVAADPPGAAQVGHAPGELRGNVQPASASAFEEHLNAFGEPEEARDLGPVPAPTAREKRARVPRREVMRATPRPSSVLRAPARRPVPSAGAGHDQVLERLMSRRVRDVPAPAGLSGVAGKADVLSSRWPAALLAASIAI